MRIPTIVLTLFSLLFPCPVFGRGVTLAQGLPVTVTTDSVDYCNTLAHRLPPAASAEVARLWQEGKSMCDQGHVRSGIMQLRRALLLARGEKPDPP